MKTERNRQVWSFVLLSFAVGIVTIFSTLKKYQSSMDDSTRVEVVPSVENQQTDSRNASNSNPEKTTGDRKGQWMRAFDDTNWEQAEDMTSDERLSQIAELENQISLENVIARLNTGEASQEERNHYGKLFERIVLLKTKNLAENLKQIQSEVESLHKKQPNEQRGVL